LLLSDYQNTFPGFGAPPGPAGEIIVLPRSQFTRVERKNGGESMKEMEETKGRNSIF